MFIAIFTLNSKPHTVIESTQICPCLHYWILSFSEIKSKEQNTSRMQITRVFGACLFALASTTAAMPHLAGPYHGQHVGVHVPTNSTGVHNATTTGTRGKAPLATGVSHSKNDPLEHPSHGLNSVDKATQGRNHCNELCSLEAQTCTIAVPEDGKYW